MRPWLKTAMRSDMAIRLFLVVGDVDERHTGLAMQPLQLLLHRFAQHARSRAESGSSSSRMRGPNASARAMATRCCWPPDNSRGLRSARLSRPTSASSISATRHRSSPSPFADLEGEGDVVGDAQMREEGIALEDETEIAVLRVKMGYVLASSLIVPLLGVVKPASDISKVVLPDPEGPSRVTNSPPRPRDLSRSGGDLVIGLCQILDGQQRHVRSDL